MNKLEKKKEKLKQRIAELESELHLSLQKKAAGPAISVPEYTGKIRKLKDELAAMQA